MKLISIFTITVLMLISSSFYARKVCDFQFYRVISDSVDETIPDGKCLITGLIYRGNDRINEATITTEKGKIVNSNKIGKFKILIDTSNTYLTISKYPFDNAYVEDYQFKNKHKITMNIYIPQEVEVEVEVDEIKVKKPVIYAYNPTPLSFSLKFKTESLNIFTYPKYDDKWTMTTTQNGMLKDQNNEEYPYLFWDGELNDLKFKKEGVKGEEEGLLIGNLIYMENVIDFLENTLTSIGFNAKEKTDFITFWAPRMTEFDEVFVQFLIDEDYDIISTMDISPKPDKIKRVYILFTDAQNLPNEIEIKQQDVDFTPIDRSGFTLVEWGGSEINTVILSNN